jgi:hypothetical protein
VADFSPFFHEGIPMKRLLLLALLLSTWLCPGLLFAQGSKSVPGMETAPNAAGGTTQWLLSKLDSTGKLVTATTTDTAISLFVCIANCGLPAQFPEAQYRSFGETRCIFDNSVTNKGGSFVVASITTGGRCHQQDTPPANGYVVGILKDANTTAGAAQGNAIIAQNQNYAPGSGGGTGTVTSINLVMPPEFTVTGGPIVAAGVLTVTEATEPANQVYAGPVSGGAAAPNFRALVAADIPVSAVGGDLAGTLPNPTVLKASGSFGLPGTLVPTALGGNVNDYCPTNFASNSTLFIDGGGSDRRITGFCAQGAGDIKQICNVGVTNTLVLGSQDTASTAANRIRMLDDLTLNVGTCTALQYAAGTVTRWQLFSGTVPDYLKLRFFDLCTGDPGASSPPLASDNDSPNAFINRLRRPLKILAVSAWCDAGATTFRPILRGGATNSILTADCTCGTGTTPAACTLNGSPIINSATGAGATCGTPPCAVDMNLTADGVTKEGCIYVDAILQ